MATEREVPFEVDRKGGFPTLEEFNGVVTALMDVDEFGVGRLLERVNGPIVDAYESGEKIEVTYEQLGILTGKLKDLRDFSDMLVEHVARLETVVEQIADIIDDNGKVEESPRVGRYGHEYEPSKEALERWGLARVS